MDAALRHALTNLPGFGIAVLRLCAWLALLVMIFVPLERLFAARRERLFRAAVGTDIAFYFLSSLVPTLLLSAPLALVAWSAHALLPAGLTDAVAHWPLWLRVVAAFAIGEAGFYWGHRWSHEIPLLWRFHAIHHSAEHLDWLVNTRVHPLDMVFTRLCGLAPLYVVGLASPLGGSTTLIPLLVLFVGTLWGFFIHANLRWRFGPLEWLIATPAFHHWHHTNDGPQFIDRNYAATLPAMDLLFGTFLLPRGQLPATFGIDAEMPPGLWRQLLHPLRRSGAGRPARQAAPAVGIGTAASGIAAPE